MQITEDDDSESRGRLAPHEVPLAMAATMVACRRLHAAARWPLPPAKAATRANSA
jgi:hypothetical protein